MAIANELEKAILREGADTVAMFLAEPVIGVGGVIVPPDDYFPRIREICDAYDVLFAADEVITGFGRTGKWFALEHWGVAPDIVQFAKAITSGYFPFGGIGVSDEIARVLDEAPVPWMHAYTYSAHPVGCAVALRTLQIIEDENLVAEAARKGAYLLDALRARLGAPSSRRRDSRQGADVCRGVREGSRDAGSRSRPRSRSARAFTPRRRRAACSAAFAATSSCWRRPS